MKAFFTVLLCIVLLTGKAAAQTRETWLPESWTTPNPVPQIGANRVIIHTADSARISLQTVAEILKKRGFSVEFPASNNLSAGRILPDSLRQKGGAAVRVTAVTTEQFPGVLVLSSNGIPNLRKLHRLAGPTAARPYGRKVYYPAEVGTNTGLGGQLPQIAFDILVAVANKYPGARVSYSTAQSPY